MAEERKSAPSQAREPRAAAAKPSLLPASQSSDPAVHQVLAELQTARSNDNQEEVERLTGRLADLGFE